MLINGYVEMTYILLFLMHFLLQTGELQFAGCKIHLGLDTQTKTKVRRDQKEVVPHKRYFYTIFHPSKFMPAISEWFLTSIMQHYWLNK